MTDTLTLTGLVATTPRHLITGEGLPITSFRLASSQRRFDRPTQTWVDGETNWYSVSTYRDAALNAFRSIQKGDRVIVRGKLRIRDWQAGEKKGTNIEIDADAFGHDLRWGTARYERTMKTAQVADVVPPFDDEFPAIAGEQGSETPPEQAPEQGDRDTLEHVATPF